MTTHPMNPVRSEQGVALIIVLLLLAVMAGLTTGLTLNGQTEIAMAHNEQYYAGARAAAEAGMNRATEQILGNITDNLMVTKAVPVIGNGPFNLTDEYSYTFEILDDDDPVLYGGAALTGPGPGTQLEAMAEDGDPNVDGNMRMVVRATATGPRGTMVTIARILESVAIPDLPTTTTINPAILVNGDLSIAGNTKVIGTQGNVHANEDVTGSGGSYEVAGNLTASGDLIGDIHATGLTAGGMPPIPVPEIKVADYTGLATHKLTSTGAILVLSGGMWVPCFGKGATECPVGWSYSLATNTWSASGSMPTSGVNKSTYWVEGNVALNGTGKTAGFTQMSVLAEGNLTVQGNGKFKPGNESGIQFVTNGDFDLSGTVDADDSLDMDGQILVREQMRIAGNSEFQGRVMVEDRDHADNIYNAVTNPNGNRGGDPLEVNSLSGNMTVTYNGSLGGITVEIPGGPDTYTNTISGWIEQ
ncbi:MAG TPA: hypothetical protein VFZ31_14520 [Vicinamibacterales bacterium]